MLKQVGKIIMINGSIIHTTGADTLSMMEIVEVGQLHLLGEVIKIIEEKVVIQVYEDTSGIKPGEPVYATGMPLSVELGPGLIGSIFDGIQRPLQKLWDKTGSFIQKGVQVNALDEKRKWHFVPQKTDGDTIKSGEALGWVWETTSIKHFILCPPDVEGKIVSIAAEGDYTISQNIAKIGVGKIDYELTMVQKWPVRIERPIYKRQLPKSPLITGQRVIDLLFPLAKGGTAALPGGFGTGKTILQHQIAKWCDADIIIYIGCGERGNEMTEVLVEFPELQDPRSGRSLMERTILVANTSNMPVTAREASIYTGITMAEYYRDMGYDVALLADSTSRWAEALRELSGRMEEMPAEEGFPAYLATRLAQFYERAGVVETVEGAKGSISVIGAVSPPSGDFSEPVTMHTKRFISTFWGLDKDLANERHYPSVNWLNSYSDNLDDIQAWWEEHVDHTWRSMRDRVVEILSQEDELQKIVKLVGSDALPDNQRLVLLIARIIRESFLQQNAYHDIDKYASPQKQIAMLRVILFFYDEAKKVIKQSIPISRIQGLAVLGDVFRMKEEIKEDQLDQFKGLEDTIYQEITCLVESYK